MKRALIATTLVVAGALSGCGGDDSDSSAADRSSAGSSGSSSESSSPSPDGSDASGAPASAADSELCQVLLASGTMSNGASISALSDRLADVDTPDGMPDEAVAGFDVYRQVLGTVDADASAEDLDKMADPDLSSAEETEVQSFFTYVGTACAPPQAPAPSAPAEAPTDPAS